MRMGRDVKIFCTEPRRISAISLAQRVSQELGEAPGACGTRNSYVGYSIRLDSQVSASTRIVYATTVRSSRISLCGRNKRKLTRSLSPHRVSSCACSKAASRCRT